MVSLFAYFSCFYNSSYSCFLASNPCFLISNSVSPSLNPVFSALITVSPALIPISPALIPVFSALIPVSPALISFSLALTSVSQALIPVSSALVHVFPALVPVPWAYIPVSSALIPVFWARNSLILPPVVSPLLSVIYLSTLCSLSPVYPPPSPYTGWFSAASIWVDTEQDGRISNLIQTYGYSKHYIKNIWIHLSQSFISKIKI